MLFPRLKATPAALVGNPSTRQAVLRCLADAGQAGPRLPEPVAVLPRGGP